MLKDIGAYRAHKLEVDTGKSSSLPTEIKIMKVVVLIIFGSAMTFVSKLKPTWVPKCFAEPIQQTDQWIMPLTLIASLFSIISLLVYEYWVITLVSTLYYGVVAVASPIGREIWLYLSPGY